MPDSTSRTDVIFRTSDSFMRLLHFMPRNSPRKPNGISSRAVFSVSNVRRPNTL